MSVLAIPYERVRLNIAKKTSNRVLDSWERVACLDITRMNNIRSYKRLWVSKKPEEKFYK